MRASTGVLVFTLLSGTASAHVGTGLDVDARGNICFSDTIHNRIVRVSSTGRSEIVARDVHTNAVACGEDGSVYFGDGDSVWGRAPHREARKLFKASILRKGLGEPLAIDSSGNSYFASGREILRITPAGFVSKWTRLASATPIRGGVLAASGVLYVKSGATISRVERGGALTRLAGGKVAGVGGLIDSPVWRQRTLGIAVDADGGVYIANHRFHRVYRVGPTKTSAIFKSSFPWTPVAVATIGTDVVLLERPGNPYGPSFVLGKRIGRHRVWRIAPDGKATLVAVVGRPSLTQRIEEKTAEMCLRAKRTAAAYLVRLLRWSVV